MSIINSRLYAKGGREAFRIIWDFEQKEEFKAGIFNM